MKKLLRPTIQSVIEKLLMMPVLFPTHKGKPGELIDKLTKEERDVLSKATSKDFNHRIC